MGAYDTTLPPKTTLLGIKVYTYGLDDYGPKRVRKTCQRMLEAEIAPWLIEQFRDWALRLPDELPTWIDTAYTDRIAAWRACVGRRLPNGKVISTSTLDRATPTSFKVILHPEPFAVPQGLTAHASWTDRIELVIAWMGPYKDDSGVVHENSWLRKCDDGAEWEIGNLIAIRHGFSPRNVSEEIGNRSPC